MTDDKNVNSFFKFADEIERELKNDLRKIRVDERNVGEEIVEKKYEELINWLQTAPKNTVIRTNTFLNTSDELIEILKNSLDEEIGDYSFGKYPKIPELIIVRRKNEVEFSKNLDIIVTEHEAIVDASCGSAVLRGAHVFAPGVMGLTSGAKIGDVISVFADASGTCKKGFPKKLSLEKKKFLGTGTLVQPRTSIFLAGTSGTGIAIKMADTISGVPQISEGVLPAGAGLFQNFPSIVCSRILDPQPGETVLDLCAAPGNKTTHLSNLMDNTGHLTALEKIKSKIEGLKKNCNNFNCKNIQIFCFDSTKAFDPICQNRNIEQGPPFAKETFDKILVDGPCSVLGKRPQIFNKIGEKELRSFVPLQRKLFSAAVELLKTGGVLVYSTCTITICENEGIVAWALKTFPSLELMSAREKYESFELGELAGSPGYSVDGLTPHDADKVLRFGPESDSVGFFIASFRKM